MYVMFIDALLQLASLKPHEDLMKEGLLTKFAIGLGQVIFVSHQWLSRSHPDPSGAQFKASRGKGREREKVWRSLEHSCEEFRGPWLKLCRKVSKTELLSFVGLPWVLPLVLHSFLCLWSLHTVRREKP
ncbi:ANKHD1 [Symbiodinium pilosum]|uniref:ANKHD1 protein n=1 Tax=Symbiodinium pilosum TaxID=2952 RepID=A0A812M9W0_SYMPI|nr:ANKHD1 [Symbiodinium pilosum]